MMCRQALHMAGGLAIICIAATALVAAVVLGFAAMRLETTDD